MGTICIVCIFFISGLKLKTEEVRNTLTAYREAAIGLFCIVFVTPLIAFVIVRSW